MPARGSWLEKSLDTVHRHYRDVVVQKVAVPTGVGRDGKIWRSRSTVDYTACVEGRFVAFDAKACTLKSFPLSNIHDHQVEHLRRVESAGGVGFLLIDMSVHRTAFVVRVSPDWIADIWIGRKYGQSMPAGGLEMYGAKLGPALDWLPTVKQWLDSSQ